jgi:DNA-binding FadR family transcriptional regulator
VSRHLPDFVGVTTDHDADIEAIAEHLSRADVIDPAELRELIPSVLILEALAVRDAPRFDAEAIAELRAANDRIRDSEGDATAAAKADDEFHRRLTVECDNPRLLEVLGLVRGALVEYERRYMLAPERLATSVAEHDAIIAALEAGDNDLAAQRVRENFTSGMPPSAGPPA